MTKKKSSRLSAPTFCVAAAVPTLEPDQLHENLDTEAVEVISNVPETAEMIAEKIDKFREETLPPMATEPNSGIVTIQNVDWAPTKVRDIPPSITQGLGMELSAQFAILYNQSKFARHRRRWAVVTNRGTVLILAGIRPEHRPANPAAFPPCVTEGLTIGEAEKASYDSNFPRYTLARVPRLWTVSLRRADCCEDSLCEEGGVE